MPGAEKTRRGRSPRLHEQVEAVLARRIAAGEIGPGEHLTETGIAAVLNVSRAPARRALHALAVKGLVRKAEGRGYVACPVPPGETGPPAVAPLVTPPPSWQRIYDEVEEELTARISFGSWRIREADLSRSYGVSRTVARDVLGRLQQRGIVTQDERGRWFAPSLTPRRVRDLYEVRAILEPAALLRAARNAPLPRVRAMLAAVEESLARPEAVDGARLDQLEHDLHIDFLGYCENGPLMEAIRAPQSLLVAHRFLYRWSARMFEVEPFLPEHRDILERLVEGDADAAAALLARHLLASSERASARVAAVTRSGKPEPLDYLQLLAPRDAAAAEDEETPSRAPRTG